MLRIFKKRERYSEELGYVIREAVPLTNAANQEWLAVPKRDIPALAEKYIGAMETEESAEWCRCEWIIHPDDAPIDRGNCRECNQPKKSHMHDERGDTFHQFRGIRKRRGDEDTTCPVHTREGMVMYFFEWIFTDAARK